jgi:lipoate-protein ligase A
MHDLYWAGVLCKYGGASCAIHEGRFDNHGTLLLLLSALRRGIELGKSDA